MNIFYMAPEHVAPGPPKSRLHDNHAPKPTPHKDHLPSRTGYAFWEVLILSFILYFIGLMLFAQTPTPLPTPRPPCYTAGWYQRVCDGSWNFADASNAGAVCPSCCGSHHYLVADDTGAWVTIIGQCPDPAHPCVGFQNLYKKPDHPSAALDAWNYYYTDPNAAAHRLLFHYYGPGVPPPGLQVLTPYKTLAQLPNPPRVAYQQAYNCNNTTPTPQVSRTPTPSPTPAPNIYAAWIEAAYNQGYMSACGPNLFCPGDSVQISTGYVSRAQEAVFILKTVHSPTYTPPKCVGLFVDVRCQP